MSTQQDYVGCVNGENRVKGYIEVEGGELLEELGGSSSICGGK